MRVQDMLSEKVPSNAPGRTYKKWVWITYVHTCVCLSICKGKYMLSPWTQKWGEIFPPKFKEVIWKYALQSAENGCHQTDGIHTVFNVLFNCRYFLMEEEG